MKPGFGMNLMLKYQTTPSEMNNHVDSVISVFLQYQEMEVISFGSYLIVWARGSPRLLILGLIADGPQAVTNRH